MDELIREIYKQLDIENHGDPYQPGYFARIFYCNDVIIPKLRIAIENETNLDRKLAGNEAIRIYLTNPDN
jgi:hypothetical protein